MVVSPGSRTGLLTRFAIGDHTVFVLIPQAGLKAGNDVSWRQACRHRALQLWDRSHGFGQAIERDTHVQVMDVVIANVAGKPLHDLVKAHVAR